MSPLHSGQEDKRGRRGWDRYLEEEEGLRRERKEKFVGFFFFNYFFRNVDCCLDEQGSTVVHEQENRLILWTLDRQINTPKQISPLL